MSITISTAILLYNPSIAEPEGTGRILTAGTYEVEVSISPGTHEEEVWILVIDPDNPALDGWGNTIDQWRSVEDSHQ